MPTPVTAKFPKPKSADEFEDLAVDVLNAEWDADLTRNGRSGQEQTGVDLFGKRRRDPGALIGVQCKNVASLSDRKIREEIAKAEGFQPALARYYFVTSLDRDVELQRVVRLLSEEREAAGKFPVEILFWDDLVRALAGHSALVAKYYGAFASLPAAGDAKLAQLLYPPYEPPPATSGTGAQSLAMRLQPRHQEKFPFIGRIKERSALMGWAERPGAGPRVCLCIGAGGQGKTRLAAEFATELQAKGWLVGFVRPGASAEALGEAIGESDALLVVDYAGRRLDPLVALLNAAESRHSGRTALLLLERSPGDWWRDLGDKLQSSRAALDAVIFAEKLHLGPLPEADRVEMLGAASAAYGHGSSAALPRDDNALSVQIAALLGISGNREELLKELLKRESSYWRQMAKAHNLSAEPGDLAAAVALATLVRPNENQARRLLQLAFERPGKIQVRGTLAWLGELYPGENSSIGALAPDMVGEALIAEQLEARPRMLGALLGNVDETAAGNVFDALARTCLSHSQVRPLVSAALRNMPQQLWTAAVRSAPTLDESFARLLTEAFDGAAAIPTDPIVAALPESTICLRELAVSAYQRKVLTLRQKLRGTRASANTLVPVLAGSLNNLSVRLRDLGRREEGLQAIQEAVETHRKLAQVKPDAFLPDLAMSLNNLSNRLGELGRREEALQAIQEAVEIRRKLAQAKPDAFLPDLATSLNNLSVHLGDLGQGEDALLAIQEAVEIRRKLAQARPVAFLSDLATSLNNLSIRLGDLGRREEALQAVQEAVETYRKLAQARPDAFLPDLAASLNNLSIILGDMARRDEGLEAVQEAVEIRRKLAQTRPDAFLPDLAMSLNNLSVRLGDLGRREEALQAIQEAVETYRKLAQARPDAFLPDLAISLNNLSIRLGDPGRREEALQAIQEAVEIHRKLARARPDAFFPDVAMSLNNLSNRLGDGGRKEEALQAIQEAVETYRKLAQARPDAFLPKLAISLNNLSNLLHELGRRDEAQQAAEEVAALSAPPSRSVVDRCRSD